MCYTSPCATQCTHPCATHVSASCTPLIQATKSVGYRRHVSCTPLMQCTNVRVQHMSVCWYTLRPCATHVRVLIQATPVCYTCPRVVYITYTSNPRPTTSVCWSVVWTTNTSNKSKCRVHDCYKLHTSTQFFSSFFFYYIRDLHILHASFSTCASDLNKTDGLRELARDWQRF